jgi:proteasome assembly chaperone (PAC2) family protein
MEDIVLSHRPELRSPYLVAGFAGWPNAGEVSTGTISYLKEKLRAEKFGEIKPHAFYDFPSLRPQTVIENGLIKELKFPTNEFFYWKSEKSVHDLIILLAVEPHLKWNEYVDSILHLAELFKVERIYTVGGTYDRVPHTARPMVTAAVSDLELKEELKRYDIEPAEYEGPCSIHTVLLAAAKRRNIKGISLWGHAPHYIQVENPKVCYGVLKGLTEMLQIEIDLEEIIGAGEYLDEQVSKAISQKPELEEYVRNLEKEYQAMEKYREPAKEEDIIREIENFLQKGQGEDEEQS